MPCRRPYQPSPSDLDRGPEERVRILVDQVGSARFARWCADLLTDRVPYDDPDSPSLEWLGGHHAVQLLELDDLASSAHAYWPPVWAARGLLHAWDAPATPAIVDALAHHHWRVREMAAKVVRQWELGDAAEALIPLLSDGTPRVRIAAVRALARVGEAEHAEPVRAAADDPDRSVAAAAERTLIELSQRLDRDLQD